MRGPALQAACIAAICAARDRRRAAAGAAGVHGRTGRRGPRRLRRAAARAATSPTCGGRNEAPQLAGGDFMNTWRTRTTRDLVRAHSGDDAARRSDR